ncbi:MAG: prepilin peptidase [Candidatus Aminicenantes bacterium]|nr:prepilin peptidase [Candidatus Aminicenantes bacterium]
MEKIILTILIGLAWGSFLNVLIFRIPRKMSILSPPSTCPECQNRIKFYHNIPVISYLWLRGKCGYCGTKIPLSYLVVELATPLLFMLAYVQYSLSVHFFTSCLFISAMILLCVIDYHHQILPDLITLPGLLLAVIYSFFRTDMNLTDSLLGAVSGAGFLLLVYALYYLIRKKEGLGMGDVTMMLFVGSYLGWKMSFLTLLAASFAGAGVGMYFIYFRKKDLQFALPFGSFLAPAAVFSLLWGNQILQAYLSLFKT